MDLHDIAKGTCLEGKSDYLNATVPPDWHAKGVMGPKEKADLTRIMLLSKFGGVCAYSLPFEHGVLSIYIASSLAAHVSIGVALSHLLRFEVHGICTDCALLI